MSFDRGKCKAVGGSIIQINIAPRLSVYIKHIERTVHLKFKDHTNITFIRKSHTSFHRKSSLMCESHVTCTVVGGKVMKLRGGRRYQICWAALHAGSRCIEQ